MAKVLPFPQLSLDFPTAPPIQLPPDAEARAEALDIHRSFIVEAPAGSGKTGLLIQRFLKLLGDESVTAPEQVLAITFTRKATAELRDRVLAHLEVARSDSLTPAPTTPDSTSFTARTRSLAAAVLERDRQLGWSLLDHPSRLNIRTIDALCAEIARSLPVLSGSGGRLAPTDDAMPLHREAARRTLLLLGGGDPAFDDALRNLLLHRDGNLADCEALIASMLSRRDQWGNLIPLNPSELDDAYLDATVLPRLELTLEHAICSGLTELARRFPADSLCGLAELAAEFSQLDSYNGEPSPLAICAGCAQPPEPIAAHLAHWHALIHLLVTPSTEKWRSGLKVNNLGLMVDRHHKARLRSLIDSINHSDELLDQLNLIRNLPPAHYPANQWAVAKSLFRVLSRALVELQLVFAERNQCDFTELNLLARQALNTQNGPDDLAAALGSRLQHLLVDEMQDTSTSQYELFELLTKSWDGYSQTVFLVGDPRQSIYLFRHARVERFVRALSSEQLGELPLTRLRLTANFRSQRNLVDQFNADFGLIFSEQSPSNFTAIPYVRADATLPASSIARAVTWHANPLPSPASISTPSTSPASQRKVDAREILAIAREWRARPLPSERKTIRDQSGNEIPEPWRIAVLVRGRTHLKEIVSALNLFNREHQPAQRIPFRAIDIDPLTQRQEILDLTALTRALLHPADRTANLAVLHAPWCGLPLAHLHTLTGADDDSFKSSSILRLINDRGHLLPSDSLQRLSRVGNILHAAITQRGRLSTAQLVERAWRSLGGDAWLEPLQLSDAGRFFQLLDTLESESEGHPINPVILQQRLQQLFAEPQPVPLDTSYIELLTIHKAKGLEWDVVFIPELERSPGRDGARLLIWSEIDSNDPLEDDSAPIMLAPIAAKGDQIDPLAAWINRSHRKREAAERKRLFYVACTRARQELHLFAAPQVNSNGAINPLYDSLLNAAWPAAEPHFAPALAALYLDSETPRRAGKPTPTASPDEPPTFAIAAAAAPSHPTLQRLPLDYDTAAGFAEARMRRLSYGRVEPVSSLSHTQFSRPEGSFAARALGNAVHTCLDLLATRQRDGASPADLLAELPSWAPRITAMLRAGGLPRTVLDRLARETRTALEKALRDPDGQWLLAPHSRSDAELALTAWPNANAPSTASSSPTSVRIDRLFHAGPEPHAAGDDYLWIIDYKTSDHSSAGLDTFLAAQRASYGPQLETYARILAPLRSKTPQQVRLALYFPAIPRLIWWGVDAPG